MALYGSDISEIIPEIPYSFIFPTAMPRREDSRVVTDLELNRRFVLELNNEHEICNRKQ